MLPVSHRYCIPDVWGFVLALLESLVTLSVCLNTVAPLLPPHPHLTEAIFSTIFCLLLLLLRGLRSILFVVPHYSSSLSSSFTTIYLGALSLGLYNLSYFGCSICTRHLWIIVLPSLLENSWQSVLQVLPVLCSLSSFLLEIWVEIYLDFLILCSMSLKLPFIFSILLGYVGAFWVIHQICLSLSSIILFLCRYSLLFNGSIEFFWFNNFMFCFWKFRLTLFECIL